MSLDDDGRTHSVLPEIPIGARIRFSFGNTDLSQPQQYLPDGVGASYLSIPGARKNELSANPSRFQRFRIIVCGKATLQEILDTNLRLQKKVRLYVYPSNEQDGMFDVYTDVESPRVSELISQKSIVLADKTELATLELLTRNDEN